MSAPGPQSPRDLPIIFSAPMVRALLDGRKTQTRRILNPQPDTSKVSPPFHPEPRENGTWVFMARDDFPSYSFAAADFKVRYRVGDRLYVREAGNWQLMKEVAPVPGRQRGAVAYAATADESAFSFFGGKKRPSIHMPRWASRITLTVTDVRVQRLHDISTDDILAEGAPIDPNYRDTTQDKSSPPMISIGCAQWVSPRGWYHGLWDSLHGKDAWDSNPWIVALTFTVEQRNIDQRAAA